MSPGLESITRKTKIDPKLDNLRWVKVKAPVKVGACRIEEYPTANGPADYVLFLNGRPVAIVEAKKAAKDTEDVLTQVGRYSKALEKSPFDFDGHRVPFLYSTNGDYVWFRDVHHGLNLSQKVEGVHSPQALRDLLAQDLDAVLDRLAQSPIHHEWLCPR